MVMSSYVTMHLHNAAEGREAAAADWFSGRHREALPRLRGFVSVQRFERTAEQIMPDIAQPWQFASVYDFELERPEIDIPALGPLLAEARDLELIRSDGTECIWSYQMYSCWRYSANWRGGALSHIMYLPANVVHGREAEYHAWYDDVHRLEVTETPGFVGMRRGRLLEIQVEPRSFCPGSQIIMAGLQTDRLGEVQEEFKARSLGNSKSGVKHGPRSASASAARTVHFFKRIG
jgi:hypothetical protein